MLGCFGSGNYGYNGQFTRASVATAPDGTQVASGVPRYGDGAFAGSKAVFVERGTTNLLPNSDFSSGTLASWVNYTNGTGAGTREVVDVPIYGKALRLGRTSGTALGAFGVNNDGQTFSANYVSGQLLFKVNSADVGSKLTLYMQPYTGSAYPVISVVVDLQTLTMGVVNGSGTAQLINLGNGWYRLSLSSTTNNHIRANFYAWLNGANADVLITKCQAEALPYPTSFVSGTRANENLSIAQGSLNPKEGAVMFQWKPQQPKEGITDINNSPRILQIGEYTAPNNVILWCINTGSSPALNIRVRSNDGGSWTFSTTVKSNSDFSSWYDTAKWYKIALRWLNYNAFTVFIDGVKYGEYVIPSNLAFLGALYLGSNAESPCIANAYYSDLTIFNTALSDADIQAKQALTTPIPIDYTTIVKCPFDGYLQSLV